MITPLASVLVNRLTGSRTIITRKMQTPPSLTYDQKLKLDDLAERLIAAEDPVTILIDGHEPEISEYLIKKLPNARVDGRRVTARQQYKTRSLDRLFCSERTFCP